MPARKRRPVLRHVHRAPQNAFSIHLRRDLVVRTQDVEVPLSQARDQPVRNLFGKPGTRMVFAIAGRGPAGHEEMGAHLATLEITQLVLQALRQALDRGLCRVVVGDSGWVRDSLLRPRVDDETRRVLFDHPGYEDLKSMDDPHQIHGKGVLK